MLKHHVDLPLLPQGKAAHEVNDAEGIRPWRRFLFAQSPRVRVRELPEAATSPTIGSNGIRPFCIPRHGAFVNGLFMDWSIRKVGVKQRWTLEWYPGFNTHGPWTRPGGIDGADWPAGMGRLKEP